MSQASRDYGDWRELEEQRVDLQCERAWEAYKIEVARTLLITNGIMPAQTEQKEA